MCSWNKPGWNHRKKAKVGVLAILLLISISSIAVALLFMTPQNNALLKQEPLTNYSAASLLLSDNVKNQGVSPSFLLSSSHSNTFTYPKDILLIPPSGNDSNVDNNANIGYHSSFRNQKSGPDGVYDTLNEGNSVPSLIEILTPDGPGSYTNLNASSGPNWNCCKSYDEDISYVYLHSKKDTNWAKDTYSLNFTDLGVSSIINWIKVCISVKMNSSDTSQGLAGTYIISGSTEFPGQLHYDVPNSYTNFSDTLSFNPDTGNVWNWSDLENLQAGCMLRLFVGREAEIRCTFVWVEVNYTIPNYELDLEVQWTGIPPSTANSSLCIRTGSNFGNETLRVDYWTGTNWFRNGPEWRTLIPILYPDQWNNESLYINNTVLTIRFKDLNDTKDEIQDSWDIDVSLVAVNYNPQGTDNTLLSLLLLGGFLLGGGSPPSLPSAALIAGSVALISVSGLAVRHFYVSGEEVSLRRRRIKQLDEVRERIQKALEDDDSGGET